MDLESQQQSMFTAEELKLIQNWANDFNNELPRLYIEQINQFVAFTIQKMNQQLQNLLNLKIQFTFPFYFDKDLQLMVIEQQRSQSTQSRYFRLHNASEFIESCQRSILPIMQQFISLATKYYISDPRINFNKIFDQDPEQINTLLKKEIQKTQQNIINQLTECPRQGEGITIQEFYRKLAEQQRKQQEIKEQEKELLLYKQKQLLYQQQEKERQEQIIKDKQYQQQQYKLEEQNRIHQQQQLLLKEQAAGNKQEFNTQQGGRNQEKGNQYDITTKNYDFQNQGQNIIINNQIDAKQYELNRPVDNRRNPNPTPQDSLRNTLPYTKSLIQNNTNLSGQKVIENSNLNQSKAKRNIKIISVQQNAPQQPQQQLQPPEMSREKADSTHDPNQQKQQQQAHQHTNSGQSFQQNRSFIRK